MAWVVIGAIATRVAAGETELIEEAFPAEY